MPRVLQVALSLNPGGTERLIVELATRLNPDTPMAVCCLDEAGVWASELEVSGIHVSALGRRPGFRPSLGRRLAEAADAHRADVLHAHHYSPFVYSAIARLRHPRLRVVFTEHGRLSDRGPSSKRRLTNRLTKGLASAVFAVSEDVKQHLIGEGFGSDQVGVIYNGIDAGSAPTAEQRTAKRQALRPAVGADACVVGTIARLDAVKDLGTLIRAASEVVRRVPIRVVIVGEGTERRALELQASDLGIAEHVTFLGHRDKARDWLAACDVYVNSSISEGVSLTILEAMAAGLPVVATCVGGTPEVIDASCGRLVPARDAAALAAAIELLAGDPPLCRNLGAAGQARVATQFTLERMVREYSEVYHGVMVS